jgi:hypothetical protein
LLKKKTFKKQRPNQEIVPADISNLKKKLVAEKSPTAQKTKMPEISDLYIPEGKLDPF